MRSGWVRGSRGLAWVMTGWLAGCGPLIVPEGETDTGSEGEGTTTTTEPPGTSAPPQPGTTSTPPPGTTVGPSTDDDGATTEVEPGSTSMEFIIPGETHVSEECDFWEQDCPRGEKCMPWANDGGSSWNALRCSPIFPDPGAPGEPCVVEGNGVSGIDSCELGAMCWDVDPKTLEGECVGFCMGSPENPLCEDANTSCVMNGDGVLALCLPNCDPLLQDCAEGQVCVPLTDEFSCAPDASGDMGAPGDPCNFINVCDPGTYCASAELVPGCDGGSAGCCTAFCDLGDALPPCLPGQECTPWYEPDQAPPGHEDVGACVLPM